MNNSTKRKNLKLNLLSYNETSMFNYTIHIGFTIGIISALTLLYIRFAS
jgi:hypothetical protein